MALSTNYVSFKSILNRVYSNPLMEGANESDIAEYVGDVMSLIGAHSSYIDKVECMSIKNYRNELPCDLLYIQQTRKVGKNGNVTPMRYSSDIFQSAYHEIGSPDFFERPQNYDFNYSLNNGVIYTNFKEGDIEMSYKAIHTDAEGFPLVPDDVKFRLAVENYIKYRWYSIQWELGKIPDKVLQKVEQEYMWYVGAAETRAQLQTLDQAESFKNAFTKILLSNTSYSKSFTDLGRQEFIRQGSI